MLSLLRSLSRAGCRILNHGGNIAGVAIHIVPVPPLAGATSHGELGLRSMAGYRKSGHVFMREEGGGLFAATLRLAAAGTSAVNERVVGADNNNAIFYDIIAHSSLFTIILPC